MTQINGNPTRIEYSGKEYVIGSDKDNNQIFWIKWNDNNTSYCSLIKAYSKSNFKILETTALANEEVINVDNNPINFVVGPLKVYFEKQSEIV